jgi:anti-sigma28 factor (negative regulator of flagellin synthesis)
LFKGQDPSRRASLKGRIADGTYEVPPNLVAAAVLSRLGIH